MEKQLNQNQLGAETTQASRTGDWSDLGACILRAARRATAVALCEQAGARSEAGMSADEKVQKAGESR